MRRALALSAERGLAQEGVWGGPPQHPAPVLFRIKPSSLFSLDLVGQCLSDSYAGIRGLSE